MKLNLSARRVSRIRLFLFVLLPLVSLIGSTEAQLPAPSPSAPVFVERPFGPRPAPTPTPPPKRVEPETKPLALGWYIAGGAAAVVAVLALLYLAVRAWRSSNLFDRQYRFPLSGEPVALRFGGAKCGGHMATVRYGPAPEPPREPVGSKAKDT